MEKNVAATTSPSIRDPHVAPLEILTQLAVAGEDRLHGPLHRVAHGAARRGCRPIATGRPRQWSAARAPRVRRRPASASLAAAWASASAKVPARVSRSTFATFATFATFDGRGEAFALGRGDALIPRAPGRAQRRDAAGLERASEVFAAAVEVMEDPRVVIGDAFGERLDVRVSLVPRDGEPQAAARHGYGGEDAWRDLEAVEHQRPGQRVHHLGDPRGHETHGRLVELGERHVVRAEHLVGQGDLASQLRLHPLDLLREVKVRRGDGGAEHGQLDRSGEDERAPRLTHPPGHLLVGQRQDAPRRGEALVQGRGEDDPLVVWQGAHGDAPTVTARPPEPVRVVHIQVEMGVPPQQLDQSLEGGGVPVHGVDAVRQVPHARVLVTQGRQPPVEPVESAVPHGLHVDAGALEQARLLHAGVDLLVQDDRVPEATRAGSAARWPRWSRGRDGRSSQHARQLRLELLASDTLM